MTSAVRLQNKDGFIRPFSNFSQAFGRELWLGIVIIRIQRPKTRIWLTVLNNRDSLENCIKARVFPGVGRLPPMAESGMQ